MNVFSSGMENLSNSSSIGDHLRSLASGGMLQTLSEEMLDRLISAVKSMNTSAQSSFFAHLDRLDSQQLEAISKGADPTLFYEGDGKAERTYKVCQGDSLSKIAKHHQVALAALIAANPQINNPDLIHPDQVIKLP